MKRLVTKMKVLKGELASKQSKLEAVRQGRQVTEAALQAQIVESEKRKGDALAALKDVSESSDVYKKNYDALHRDHKKLSDDLKDMNETIQLEHNRAEKVNDHAEEEFARAKLIGAQLGSFSGSEIGGGVDY